MASGICEVTKKLNWNTYEQLKIKRFFVYVRMLRPKPFQNFTNFLENFTIITLCDVRFYLSLQPQQSESSSCQLIPNTMYKEINFGQQSDFQWFCFLSSWVKNTSQFLQIGLQLYRECCRPHIVKMQI